MMIQGSMAAVEAHIPVASTHELDCKVEGEV